MAQGTLHTRGNDMKSPAFWLRAGALFGASAVILGAFGAHALKDRLTPGDLEIFETGVRYQFYHALALLALAAGAPVLWTSRWSGHACTAWTVGILIFSGSLYLLVLTNTRWLGAITPIGGVALILGWLLLLPATRTRSN